MSISALTSVPSEEVRNIVASWSKAYPAKDSFTSIEIGEVPWAKFKEPERTAPPGIDKNEQELITSNGEKSRQKSISRKVLDDPPVDVGGDFQKLDEKAERIIRVHFADQILTDLSKIRTVCGQSAAAVYASRLLRTILRMGDVLPYDPLLEILMALHDALAFENRWAEIGAAQYAKAYDLIKPLVGKKLTLNQVEKAIMKLEAIGFDTTPIPLELDHEE